MERCTHTHFNTLVGPTTRNGCISILCSPRLFEWPNLNSQSSDQAAFLAGIQGKLSQVTVSSVTQTIKSRLILKQQDQMRSIRIATWTSWELAQMNVNVISIVISQRCCLSRLAPRRKTRSQGWRGIIRFQGTKANDRHDRHEKDAVLHDASRKKVTA